LGFLVRERVLAALADREGLTTWRLFVRDTLREAAALGLATTYDHFNPETTAFPLIPPS
jgi:hypothetical protein